MNKISDPGSLSAIIRDPHTIFVYWDADSIGSDKLTGKPGANVRAVTGWLIRLYCRQNQETKEYPVQPEAGRHYFHNLQSGQTYRVTLCQVDTMGDAHSFLTCGEITLPLSGFSGLADVQWPVTREDIIDLIGADMFDNLGASDNFMLRQ